ncbi:hypothetical protein KKP04_00790 [Rhodomicrobium sp. Az07]|uniref:hypothetical protein n=1 Tax=Rhodomicrobium sp. Az07 TaxID=2839034 RepID=UPI001BEBF860|nr:hypothetical protein [Rhodomicrobium sp. Az07]MBT3069407.1 hypothetical protein [Rhodomicrobium sp. Az07]
MANTRKCNALPSIVVEDSFLSEKQKEDINGILAALRYLTREAEGAGLSELAKALIEVETKCDQGFRKNHNRCQA